MPIPTGAETPIVGLDEFSTYLNDDNLDTDRAELILGLAQTLCESVVSPLPAGADIVILDVAQRAYANPTSVRNSAAALYSDGVGPFSDGTPGVSGGGLWLTQENKATLRRLNGSGGAFMVDTLPADFVPVLAPWDGPNVWLGGSTF
jgi:hypothetical protein